MRQTYSVGRTAAKVVMLGVFLALQPPAATVNGSVAGSVVDDAGRPVAGAHVVVSYAPPSTAPHLAAPPVITGPLAQTGTTDALGSFMIPNLRAGRYIACAQTLTQGLLDPCRWAASAPQFTVVAGQEISGLKISMARGAVISIHVDDAQGLLKAVTGPFDSDCQFHIVTGKGLHYNANIQASTAVSRDHAITVPFSTPLTLQVISPHLVLSDSSGAPVPAQAASIAVPAGTVSPTITYKVTGRK